MKTFDFNGEVHIVNLKLPPEWALMPDDVKDNYVRQNFLKQSGREPDNIIPFRLPQDINLNNCF